MAEQARIRIHGHGEIEVQLIADYLHDIQQAYNAVLVFETTIDRYVRVHREISNPIYPGIFVPPFAGRGFRSVGDWPPTDRQLNSLVPHAEQLVLMAVRLESPGFWDFLGKLNPLEVVRQYLNDRHERRKDREYREDAEARKLQLENLQRENSVIRERIQIARELGATERDLAPLLNELVFRPLGALERHQDKGVIENVEVLRLPPKPRNDDDA